MKHLLLVCVILTIQCLPKTLQRSHHTSINKFQVVNEWQVVNFTWPSPTAYQQALALGKYVPESVVIAGIKSFKGTLYVALPRIRPGVPVTLGYVTQYSYYQPGLNNLIEPFPSWQLNSVDTCDSLQNVQSMEIDPSGVMWVLDGIRINNNTLPGCPPKILLIDLVNANRIIQVYNFPVDVCLTQGGFLNDLVIDDDQYAYITDNSAIDPGLIVFSRAENRAWKFRHGSMFPEVRAQNFQVGGLLFGTLSPIDGIALSPRTGGARTVYYCSLTGLGLFAMDTDTLKNESLMASGDWRNRLFYAGRKQSQSDGMAMDNQGNLFYTLLPLYGVGLWNIYSGGLEQSSQILDQDTNNMVWTDSFGFDNEGYLYLLANNIHKFFDPNYVFGDPNEVKIRVLRLFTGTLSYLY